MPRTITTLAWVEECALARTANLRIGRRPDARPGEPLVAWLTIREPESLSRLERARVLALAESLESDPGCLLWFDLTLTAHQPAGRPIRRVAPGRVRHLAACMARACGA